MFNILSLVLCEYRKALYSVIRHMRYISVAIRRMLCDEKKLVTRYAVNEIYNPDAPGVSQESEGREGKEGKEAMAVELVAFAKGAEKLEGKAPAK